MGKRFYVVLLSALFISLLLLGFSFSKESGNGDIAFLSELETEEYIVHFSNDGEIDTSTDNPIDLSIVNKTSKRVSYYLYFDEVDKKILRDVYYSVNGRQEKKLTSEVIKLGNLKAYGEEGDFGLFQVSIKSKNKYRFKLDVKAMDSSLLRAKVMDDENVFITPNGDARYFGEFVNNYVFYEDQIYRILGVYDDHIHLISEAGNLSGYNEENHYLSKKDYLASFNGKTISEETLTNYKSWLNDGKDFWLSGESSDTFYYASGDNGLGTSYPYSNYYIREVLEVDKNLVVTNGDGTQSNPYEVTYGS